MKKANDIFTHTDCVSEEMLSKYIAGKLPPSEKHEVEKHLIDCEMCSDAVDGLTMMDSKRISSITSELNQKIRNRVEKKEVKVIFLRQYRTQLAVAASIVLVLGLVWFFKANISMKEMDNAEADKIFVEKFSPPPAEKDEEVNTGKEQTEPDAKGPEASAQDPAPNNSVALEEAEKKAVLGGEVSHSANGEAKSGKDLADEKHFAENLKQEDIPMQKADELRKGIAAKKSEEKENVYWRNKNAEEPKGNVTVKSEVTTRDEDADVLKDEVSKVTVAKEEYEKNQNELKSLEKEKDKKDESKKTQSVPSLTPAESTAEKQTVTTTAGASSVSSTQPVTDKSSALKQDNKKTTDDRERTDANNVNRGQKGEGDVLAYETETKSGGKGKKSKLEQGVNFKKAKEPQKVSGGYTEVQTASAPMPEKQSQTKTTQTEANGKAMDSVSASLATFGSTISNADTTIALDGAMIKYDKQDYSGAVTGFENALKQNQNDEKALYYSAVSYLSLGQTEKALANLNKILANKNSKYYDDAQWYSSLAYIKNNDMKNARANLQQIQQNEKSRYKKQADETLEHIKK